jgi:phenylpropionate dioxygenase-like ring-hydroxylating dioxygenase large terminal subunit
MIVCPFHGYRVGIGHESPHTFRVHEYPTLTIAGLIFVRLSDGDDHGFAAMLTRLDAQRFIVPGLTMRVETRPEMVIENAFDTTHFRSVHQIGTSAAFAIGREGDGALTATGVFEVPPVPDSSASTGNGASRVPFVARAFSPGLVVTELGGAHPYAVITAATPAPEGGCVIRLSLALSPEPTGAPPSPERCQYLLRQSHAGLEKDRLVWEHMATNGPCHYVPQDAPVLAFRRFCHDLTAQVSA